MNLFEKIFNYQMISRLEESGVVALTSHERTWLKSALKHPAAEEAFAAETLAKLHSLLEEEADLETDSLVTEKAKSPDKQVYHPLLRPLRRFMREQQGIRLSYRIRNGHTMESQSGIPYKLEYSMVKKEWYLLWYHLRNRMYMATKLGSILDLEAEAPADGVYEEITAKLDQSVRLRKESSVIEVVRTYNRELSRILYAFSCFEKEVSYDDESDLYRIRLTYMREDAEYILSKIRFLGMRVKVVEGRHLRWRMADSSARALARYGDEPEDNNGTSPDAEMEKHIETPKASAPGS
ncbi:WYL domain-containing protein [Paenibacillus chitinolyticus]|uniref:WYL domain-containing protein n=1 Tax=Paenibacillus chitinolyticus TaxID=79263 RepID=UPI0035DD3218